MVLEQIQILSCYFMTGLIWLIQLVHYPSFHYVNQESFSQFHRTHSSRITLIVLPMMGLELGTGVLLWYQSELSLWFYNLIGIILIWLSTGLLSVRYHNLLSQERNDLWIKRLIDTNWVRTLLWSVRTLGLIYYSSVIKI